MVEQSNFKIEKIKSMAVGLQSYLWPCKDDSDGKINLYNVPCVPFCPNWIEAYTDNIYIKALQSTIFVNSNIYDDGNTIINRTALAISNINNVAGTGFCNCESPFSASTDAIHNEYIDTLMRIGLTRDSSDLIKHTVNDKDMGSLDTMFWMFMMAALDERIYNDQLEYITDLAEMLEFNEPMVRDWCKAAVYVVGGGHLQDLAKSYGDEEMNPENNPLGLTTPEGREFFLHMWKKNTQTLGSFSSHLHRSRNQNQKDK